MPLLALPSSCSLLDPSLSSSPNSPFAWAMKQRTLPRWFRALHSLEPYVFATPKPSTRKSPTLMRRAHHPPALQQEEKKTSFFLLTCCDRQQQQPWSGGWRGGHQNLLPQMCAPPFKELPLEGADTEATKTEGCWGGLGQGSRGVLGSVSVAPALPRWLVPEG